MNRIAAITLGMACLAVCLFLAMKSKADDAASQPSQPTSRVTASGLQITDVKEGTGDAAAAGDTVTVNYTGRFKDQNGAKFDSSYDRNQPFQFALGQHQVIAGWDEGVAGMKVGGKRQLIIPPDLAYGPGGTPDGTIPPNSTLYFDVELLAIQKP